jgi:peptide/nickel transport system substrate-binding protein
MTPQVRFMPPEWVEQHPEGSNEWKDAVGTGPWMVTDFVVGSTFTCSKNPDYWGYDERYPQNKLPYVDTYKQIAIPDISTALAALRTGKIDMIVDFSGGPSWQQAASIAETNPEIQQATLPSEAAAVEFRCDRAPFTDIRVRQALQMAIDIPTIAETHYGGLVDGVPVGGIPPSYTGWTTPYDQWPADLKEAYAYNPEKAKQLLADAGFPQGFKTDIVASSGGDLELLQIIKAYFLDIGVNMEIQTMDEFAKMDFLRAGKHDAMSYGRMADQTLPWQAIITRQSEDGRNVTFNNDATFDAMIDKAMAATNIEESMRLLGEADMYLLRQFWSANLCVIRNSILWEPYVKGYSGERSGDVYLPRLWIDQNLKKSLGH